MSNFMSTEPKWYILHTFSGYEAVAKQNLEQVVEMVIYTTEFLKS